MKLLDVCQPEGLNVFLWGDSCQMDITVLVLTARASLLS